VISYAQNGEDVILARALAATEHGFYVDVGAASPTEATVTRHFYEAGWHGVNFEPVPGWAAALRSLRPRDMTVEAAAGAEPGELVFYEVIDDPALSTGGGEGAARLRREGHELREVRVPVVTLDAVLSDLAPERIDFLKIDVEGAERDVLLGIDLQRWRPRIVVIEATEPNSLRPAYASWEELLTGRRYLYAATDGINRYYVREEDAPLAELLVPVNSLDDAVPMREQLLHDEIGRLRNYVHSLEAGRAELAERVETLGSELQRLRAHQRRAALAPASPVQRSRPVAPLPAPLERIAVLAAPGTGSLALAAGIAKVLGCVEATAEHPADLRLEAAAPRAVVHVCWPRRERLAGQLRRHSFQVVTIGRHPFEILLAALRLVSVEPAASEWLGRSDEDAIAGARPNDPRFLDWASSERGRALVEVSASWWREPGTWRVRFGEWQNAPSSVLERLWDVFHPATGRSAAEPPGAGAPRPLPGAGSGLEDLPGGWRAYLSADATAVLADAHRDALDVLGDGAPDLSGLPSVPEAAAAWARLAATSPGSTTNGTSSA
jgi:FkbM family methyltransferase